MNTHLVVVRAFAAYAKAETIAEPDAIAAVLAGEHVRNVVRVAEPAATHSNTKGN